MRKISFSFYQCAQHETRYKKDDHLGGGGGGGTKSNDNIKSVVFFIFSCNAAHSDLEEGFFFRKMG
jgi:hypothetical protein